MNAAEREALQNSIGKTIADIESKGGGGDHTLTLNFTDGTRLRIWAWDEYGKGDAGLAVEWLLSEEEMMAGVKGDQ